MRTQRDMRTHLVAAAVACNALLCSADHIQHQRLALRRPVGAHTQIDFLWILVLFERCSIEERHELGQSAHPLCIRWACTKKGCMLRRRQAAHLPRCRGWHQEAPVSSTGSSLHVNGACGVTLPKNQKETCLASAYNSRAQCRSHITCGTSAQMEPNAAVSFSATFVN